METADPMESKYLDSS